MADDYLIVLCTCPDQDTGKSIAESVVNEGLAACINILPGLTSIYRWQGELQTGTEVLLMIKTLQTQYPKVEKALKALHPYELPEIIAVPITAGFTPYLNWITECCQNQ